MWRRLPSLLSRLVSGKRPLRPPNVLWICADDFAPYVSGCYGNPLAKTPNMDRLANSGMRFDRAFCACPLSTPSRMAFLTGRCPRSVGVTLSRTPLPRDEVTIGTLLRKAGYEAVAIGKTHYYDPLDREFDRCIDLDDYERWREGRPDDAIPAGVEVLGPWRPFRDPVTTWLNCRGLPQAPDDEVWGTFFTRKAEEFFDEKRTKPFFLSVGFYETHAPFRFPIAFPVRFDPSSFTVPEIGPEDRDRIPEVFRNLSEREKQGSIASYYRSVAYMDRNLGRILDALDRSGLADETIVIFNSDHGYLLGHHGRFEKHCSYEEAVRVALLMRWPGEIPAGSDSGAMIELVDVVPTILDLCGVAIPDRVQGRSFAKCLRGRGETHRDHVIAEYADNAEAMIRTSRWKLVFEAGTRKRRDGYALAYAPPGPLIRLYDLSEDPGELTSVADRPGNAEVVADLLRILADHMKRTARDASQVAEADDACLFLERNLGPWEYQLRERDGSR